MRARVIAADVAIGLRRNLTMTLAVVITTWVALGFFAAGLLFSHQVDTMKGEWYDKIEVSIYLCTAEESASPGCAGGETTEAQRNELRAQLERMPEVERVYYESKAQAYANFKDMFEGQPIAENVGENAIPDSFRVKLVDPTQYEVIATRFFGEPGVDTVEDSREYLDKFFAIVSRLQIGAYIVAGVTLVAAMLLISNTIRVMAFSRRRETGIMRLVGASRFYIQLPFLIEGALAGLLGAGLTVASMVAFEKFIIIDQARQQLRAFPFIGWSDIWATVPWVLGLGLVLASLASLLTLRRYLRV
ncbi:permease-like cell division protein FtsX [Motilibacter aurantiacus]|uniref:permease-like cell division protein FtsX n=1 Tax=Motilibacter aurantiacus TaxID=2714955 RepID=UPI00140864B1|nr:ABC transporter permease [Motilibacter aurantiacus]